MSSSPSKPPSPKRSRSTSPSHPIILILVGLPGSGKSNFASALVTRSPHRWARINQDTINKGKRGTKELCLAAAQSALSRGCNVVIDRTNLSQAQRKDFLDLASKADPAPAALHCVFFNLPTKACGARAAQREDHEGGVQGPNAYRAVGMMQRELTNGGAPTLQEGFVSMVECLDDQDIDAALELWVPYSESDAVGGLTLTEEWEKVRPKKRKSSGNGGLQRLDKFFGQKKEKLGAAGEEGVEKVLEGKEVSQMGKKEEESGRGALGTNRVAAALAQPAAAQAREGISQAQPSTTNTTTINTNAPSTSNAFSFMMAAAKQQAHQPGGGGSPSPSKSQLKKHQSSRHTFLSHGAISALNSYLKDPERLLQSGDALFCDSQCVAVDDKFPKARFHILVIARDLRLQGPMDLTGSDIDLVRHMKEVGLRLAAEHASPAASAAGFALGFHSIPSMRHLHLHVISKDYDSPCLKHKKHWNSFTTRFFLDVDWVLQRLEDLNGTADHLEYDLEEKHALEKGIMRCPKCKLELRNMPAVKTHVATMCTGNTS